MIAGTHEREKEKLLARQNGSVLCSSSNQSCWSSRCWREPPPHGCAASSRTNGNSGRGEEKRKEERVWRGNCECWGAAGARSPRPRSARAHCQPPRSTSIPSLQRSVLTPACRAALRLDFPAPPAWATCTCRHAHIAPADLRSKMLSTTTRRAASACSCSCSSSSSFAPVVVVSRRQLAGAPLRQQGVSARTRGALPTSHRGALPAHQTLPVAWAQAAARNAGLGVQVCRAAPQAAAATAAAAPESRKQQVWARVARLAGTGSPGPGSSSTAFHATHSARLQEDPWRQLAEKEERGEVIEVQVKRFNKGARAQTACAAAARAVTVPGPALADFCSCRVLAPCRRLGGLRGAAGRCD